MIKTIPQDAPRVDGIPCGRNEVCLIARNEVCVGGLRCMCRPGEARNSAADRCQPVEKIPLSIRVLTRDSEPLLYSSEYGNSDNIPYVEITHLFSNDLGRTIGSTSYAPRYVATDVNYITHPKTVNRYIKIFVKKYSNSMGKQEFVNFLNESYHDKDNLIGLLSVLGPMAFYSILRSL